MTVVDLKIATDRDGTEHWERVYVPDEQGLIFRFESLDDSSVRQFVSYDTTVNLTAEQAINVSNERAFEISLCYWLPADLISEFPEDAILGDLTFRYTIRRPILATDPDTVFSNLTRDFLDGATVTTQPPATDHTAIHLLVGDPDLGTAYFDPPVVDFSTFAQGDEVSYDLPVSDDLWTAMRGQPENAAIRFAFFAQSGSVSDADDSTAVFSTLNEDGVTVENVSPIFVRLFTIPSAIVPPPTTAPVPRHTEVVRHVARLRLMTQRQRHFVWTIRR